MNRKYYDNNNAPRGVKHIAQLPIWSGSTCFPKGKFFAETISSKARMKKISDSK